MVKVLLSPKKSPILICSAGSKKENVVISDEVGLRKPDPRIFTHFNRLMNLQANEVVISVIILKRTWLVLSKLAGTPFGLTTGI